MFIYLQYGDQTEHNVFCSVWCCVCQNIIILSFIELNGLYYTRARERHRSERSLNAFSHLEVRTQFFMLHLKENQPLFVVQYKIPEWFIVPKTCKLAQGNCQYHGHALNLLMVILVLKLLIQSQPTSTTRFLLSFGLLCSLFLTFLRKQFWC